MLLGDVQHQLQLVTAEYGACGIAGVGYHYYSGVFVDGALQGGPVGVGIAPLGVGGHRVDGGTGQGDGGVVVGVEGFWYNYLVPVVQDGGHYHLQGLAAAGGGEDLGTLQLHADAFVVAPHGIQKLGYAAGGGVGQHRVVEITDGLIEYIRGFDIGLADIQMVDFDSAFSGGCGIGVEFTHGRESAAFHFGRQLHSKASFLILGFKYYTTQVLFNQYQNKIITAF